MEPITASKTTTKINTQQIYPQPSSNRKATVIESSNSSGSGSGDRSIGEIGGLEENGALVESRDITIGEDIFSEDDPFLLVSLRASKRSLRPQNVSYLYLIALLDLSIITVCTILLVHKDRQGHWHWRKAAWDWVALGLIRFIAVVGIASSKWIREMRWILGGVCCFSSLYIIFKANLIFQQKRSIDKYRIILLISSFLFCQVHWIAYVVVTTDSRRKAKFLGNRSIVFEEESRNVEENNNEDSLSNRNHPTLRSYSAIANRETSV